MLTSPHPELSPRCLSTSRLACLFTRLTQGRLTHALLLVGLSAFLSEASAETISTPQAGVYGEPRKWHRLTIAFEGPDSSEKADPNPYTDYRLDVSFTHPESGKRYSVPGYYAADGNAANTSAEAGKIWRVHFAPDEIGAWRYKASFRQGENVAVDPKPDAGASARYFDGKTGTIEVLPTDKTGIDNRARGLARYVGKHHLQFAESGDYFLKGGADSPENFLGYDGFDNTIDYGGVDDDALGEDGLHSYDDHHQHFDPDHAGAYLWKNGLGKDILGAIKYLSDQGMNSIYFLTYNIDGGDGRETHPWIGEGSEKRRFDASKLDQWESVLSYMDRCGILAHAVLQETENDQELGDPDAIERRLYHREMVARFAHHLNLQWNLGEENDNTDEEIAAFARQIRDLDPYDHPIAVHIRDNRVNRWEAFYGKDFMESASIQSQPETLIHGQTTTVRRLSAAAGRPWLVYEDEQNRIGALPDGSNWDAMRQEVLWGNLMGGGAGVEWYFYYHDDANWGDIEQESWRPAQGLWDMTRHALEFFQEHVPFWEMAPQAGLSSNPSSWTLSKPGSLHLVYLKAGGTTDVDLSSEKGTFSVRWFDPRQGGDLQTGSVSEITAGKVSSIGHPPSEKSKDWAVLLSKK